MKNSVSLRSFHHNGGDMGWKDVQVVLKSMPPQISSEGLMNTFLVFRNKAAKLRKLLFAKSN